MPPTNSLYRAYMDAAEYHHAAVRRVMSNKQISTDVVSHIISLYDSLVKDLSAETIPLSPCTADIFCYNFGPSLKMLVIIDGQIVGDCPYWLDRLPFVKKRGTFYELFAGVNEIMDCSPSGPFLPLIHHNHYGHFIGDALGQLEHFRREHAGTPIVTVEPCEAIDREIKLLLGSTNVRYLPRPPVGSGMLYRNLLLIPDIWHPWLYSLHLSRQHILPTEKLPREGCLFLLRKDAKTSRIQNITEIMGLANSIGAEVGHAEGMCMADIASYISNFKSIVTEAGSCHLNAMLAAPTASKLIALTPESMLSRPTQEMVLGGWPYIAFHPNVTFLPSCVENRQAGHPMTSWSCAYSLDKIELTLTYK